MTDIQTLTLTAENVVGMFALAISLQLAMLIAIFVLCIVVASHKCSGTAKRLEHHTVQQPRARR